MPMPLKADLVAGVRPCASCKQVKPLDDFRPRVRKDRGGRVYWESSCQPCRADRWRLTPEQQRRKTLKHRYRITPEQFDALLESQGGRCATCRTSDPGVTNWQIDHDHACCPPKARSCGKCVRGILCRPCNKALGLTRDSVETLRQMVAYLDGAPGPGVGNSRKGIH